MQKTNQTEVNELNESNESVESRPVDSSAAATHYLMSVMNSMPLAVLKQCADHSLRQMRERLQQAIINCEITMHATNRVEQMIEEKGDTATLADFPDDVIFTESEKLQYVRSLIGMN